MMEKVLVEIGNTFGNHMKVARVNVEAEEERAATFEIQALPTLFVLYDNLIVDRMIGYRDADTLTKELLNVYLLSFVYFSTLCSLFSR